MAGLHSVQHPLVGIIDKLANQGLNPLQLLLRELGIDTFTTDTKYPEGNLTFGNANWRTFFHIHGNNPVFPDEYGHFHIFTALPDDTSWSHVIALSMDAFGQPVHWFTTNHWVTAGEWLLADQMAEVIAANLDKYESSGLLVDWLYAMLQFYREQIITLLHERDEVISKGEPSTLLVDHDLYKLSWVGMDLLHDLTAGVAGSTRKI